ncbi:MAG: hypothetical protein L0H29_03100, partial [Sinobacteraceae bacterium]|nr:hypothetical protein [Nevskiaceae bacterium]
MGKLMRGLESRAVIPTDCLFSEPRSRVDDFNFGEDTAAVFDDMLDRSVPFYPEIQRMVAELAADYAHNESAV